MKKKKVIFVLPSLKAGGAERVISFVASNIDPVFFETILLVIGSKEHSVYETSVDELIFLNKKRLLSSLFDIYKLIFIKKPDIVVSSISHVNVYMGFLGLLFRRTKFIGREASVLSAMSKFIPSNQKVLRFLMKIFYPNLAAIVCQSQDMKRDLVRVLKLNPDKLEVIHNPITHLASDLKKVKKNSNEEVRFITIGRLSKEKGYFRILEGLSKINQYSFTYKIIGSGPLEQKIKEYAKELKLNENIEYIPYTSNVLLELKNSDFFLQGSFVEGFPNGVLESCTVGTPVIAFDAPGGTSHIIENDLNGYIVDDEDAFATLLMDLNNQKFFLPSKVNESVMSKFHPKIILQEYINLFSKVS